MLWCVWSVWILYDGGGQTWGGGVCLVCLDTTVYDGGGLTWGGCVWSC